MASAENPPGGGSPPDIIYSRSLPEWFGPKDDTIILQLSPTEGNNLPKNPFTISKSVQLDGGRIDYAKTEAKGTKYTIKVRGRKLAEKILKLDSLIDGTPIQVTPHPQLNFTRCVVTCRDVLDLGDEELLTELKYQNVTSVRRITRKVQKETVKTASLVLTVAGIEKPEYIYFGLLRIPTRPYYPSPMLCFKCLNYGHTKLRCEGNEKCQNCSQEHEGDCQNPTFCLHCKRDHSALNRQCPKYLMEDQICKMQIDLKISFPEARRLYESKQKQPSYAEISSPKSPLQDELHKKDQVIQQLRKEIEELKTTCKTLQSNFQKAKTWIQRSQSLERNRSQSQDNDSSTKSIKIVVEPPKPENPTKDNYAQQSNRKSRSLAPTETQNRSVTPVKRIQSDSQKQTQPPQKKQATIKPSLEYDSAMDIASETEIPESQDMFSQN
ncbi:uncharacterized protein LOC129749562 isoform X1 [Uranotaenia lowii]|uniref:uncharacterized protein LOC129749562 isoform X1 n=1 Tax=Uranotaenia lowii TaxID=190385 RepID=UPI0024789330|nr:uncharacterized protein LOC129749562 isoform X1 [Uranotaenia lowii]XP_055600550.1 uncharacterized protein LOC129749562 isoform X1 [Uranotaenia lowii]